MASGLSGAPAASAGTSRPRSSPPASTAALPFPGCGSAPCPSGSGSRRCSCSCSASSARRRRWASLPCADRGLADSPPVMAGARGETMPQRMQHATLARRRARATAPPPQSSDGPSLLPHPAHPARLSALPELHGQRGHPLSLLRRALPPGALRGPARVGRRGGSRGIRDRPAPRPRLTPAVDERTVPCGQGARSRTIDASAAEPVPTPAGVIPS